MKFFKSICAYLIISCVTLYATEPSLLIKMPTRSRPHQFFRNLDLFYQNLSFKIPYQFLISCDLDDETMNNETVIRRLDSYPNLSYNFSDNSSKVEAFNRDIDAQTFDVIVAVHDDMAPTTKGYDQIIMQYMEAFFPNFDGVLNFNDGFVGRDCNTLPVIGRAFYERFGYIYNPAYKALVCNLELTCVSKILRKEKVIDQIIIKHNHPAWGAGHNDALYEKNETYHEQDRQTFMQRRAQQFEIPQVELEAATPMLWSILICTIDERKESFDKLCTKLKQQINELNLQNQIEILACKDKRGEHTVGFKRNNLIEGSHGKYISFIDDDDDIHDNFIEMIYEKLKHNPDCVSLTGIITFNGTNAKTFIHSIKYDTYFEQNNTYFRPPNHINTIRRSVAAQFSFPEKNIGEDTDWAMSIARSKLLQQEEEINTPYYFYLYKEKE